MSSSESTAVSGWKIDWNIAKYLFLKDYIQKTSKNDQNFQIFQTINDENSFFLIETMRAVDQFVYAIKTISILFVSFLIYKSNSGFRSRFQVGSKLKSTVSDDVKKKFKKGYMKLKNHHHVKAVQIEFKLLRGNPLKNIMRIHFLFVRLILVLFSKNIRQVIKY